ncbi:hypothetical protein DL93DRAFT_1244622 [Clavulina sp. PMI_390]|nr:hypothetical protein DL93DRAFT_1244622 [Clavulina sp. PMI_390]
MVLVRGMSASSLRTPHSTNVSPNKAKAKTSPIRAYVPWDIVASIIDQADPETLKELSLVSKEFSLEAASGLCHTFSVCLAPRSSTNRHYAVTRLSDATLCLQKHSRFRHIRHIRFRICTSLGPSNVARDSLGRLFRAIQRLENLEVLELDILHHQIDVVHSMRTFPLARAKGGLAQIVVTSCGPALPFFRDAFRIAHAPRLRSCTLLASSESPAPAPIIHPTSQRTYDDRLTLPALEHLHVRQPSLLGYLSLSVASNMRSLVIDHVRPTDLDHLRATLVPSPSSATPFPTIPLNQMMLLEPGHLHSTPTTTSAIRPARSSSYRTRSTMNEKSPDGGPAGVIETLCFGYQSTDMAPDPSIMYTEIASRLSALRYLVARHCPFPHGGESSALPASLLRTASALRHLRCLEVYHLMIPMGTPMPLSEPAWSSNMASLMDCFARFQLSSSPPASQTSSSPLTRGTGATQNYSQRPSGDSDNLERALAWKGIQIAHALKETASLRKVIVSYGGSIDLVTCAPACYKGLATARFPADVGDDMPVSWVQLSRNSMGLWSWCPIERGCSRMRDGCVRW